MITSTINHLRYIKPILNTTKLMQYCNKTTFDVKSIVNKSLENVMADQSKISEIATNAVVNASIITFFSKDAKFSTNFCASAIQDIAKETIIQSLRSTIQDPNFIDAYKKYLIPDSKNLTDISIDEAKTQEVLTNLGLIASASNIELAYAILKLSADFSTQGLPTEESDSTSMVLIKIVDSIARNLKEENKLKESIKISNQIQNTLKESNLLGNAKDKAAVQLDSTLTSANRLKDSLSKYWGHKE